MDRRNSIIASAKVGGITMAQTKAITFEEFRKQYETEEACREELFRLRFPEGFVCPKCGCWECYPIRKRSICQCRNCRRQTSVTAGTVMHRTHLPLTNWFWAMYLCATDKRGSRHLICKGFWMSAMKPHGIFLPESAPPWTRDVPIMYFPGW